MTSTFGSESTFFVENSSFTQFLTFYVDANGNQLVAMDDMSNDVELGNGGSELIITRRTEEGVVSRALGSREYFHYYRQRPRPSSTHNLASLFNDDEF